VVHPELIVDKARGEGDSREVVLGHVMLIALCIGEKMEIHLNITFPKIPCELLTLDVMDVSGELQVGVMHGVSKIRLSPQSEGGHIIDVKALDL